MTGGLKVRVRGGCGSPDAKWEDALSKRRSSPVLVQNGVPLRARRDWQQRHGCTLPPGPEPLLARRAGTCQAQ